MIFCFSFFGSLTLLSRASASLGEALLESTPLESSDPLLESLESAIVPSCVPLDLCWWMHAANRHAESGMEAADTLI
jgi:hypothetical protein